MILCINMIETKLDLRGFREKWMIISHHFRIHAELSNECLYVCGIYLYKTSSMKKTTFFKEMHVDCHSIHPFKELSKCKV